MTEPQAYALTAAIVIGLAVVFTLALQGVINLALDSSYDEDSEW